MLDKDSLKAEVSVGVTFAALMSATSLFFTGVLISQYSSFSSTIRVPLIFLIISTFSFIFSATIYSNAGAEITLGKLKLVEKYMVFAKNIVELLGLYLFILATPLVIGAVTNDSFLRTSTIIIALVGFALYSQSKFSVLEKELSHKKKNLLSGIIVVLSIALYLSQAYESGTSLVIYSMIAIVLILVLLAATYFFCIHSKQYKPTHFRAYREGDGEVLSAMIQANLGRVKGKDYSKEVMEKFRASITSQSMDKLSNEQKVTVAEFNGKVVGLGALDKNVISSVYADTSLHRKGVGRMIVEQLEDQAKASGYDSTEVTASSLDQAFYRHMGYSNIREMGKKGSDQAFLMRKNLG